MQLGGDIYFQVTGVRHDIRFSATTDVLSRAEAILEDMEKGTLWKRRRSLPDSRKIVKRKGW